MLLNVEQSFLFSLIINESIFIRKVLKKLILKNFLCIFSFQTFKVKPIDIKMQLQKFYGTLFFCKWRNLDVRDFAAS